MKHFSAAARRGYRLRRLSVALMATVPAWSLYCYVGTQSVGITILGSLAIGAPVLLLISALLGLADIELAHAQAREERRMQSGIHLH